MLSRSKNIYTSHRAVSTIIRPRIYLFNIQLIFYAESTRNKQTFLDWGLILHWTLTIGRLHPHFQVNVTGLRIHHLCDLLEYHLQLRLVLEMPCHCNDPKRPGQTINKIIIMQWRIKDFSKKGVPTERWERQPIILANFPQKKNQLKCMKMKKKWTREQGCTPLVPPPETF